MLKLIETKVRLISYLFVVLCYTNPFSLQGQTQPPGFEQNPISGYTLGAFSVSNFGGPNYTMQLMVAPAPLDVCPKLQLRYIGHSGEGYLGGFAIGDFPTIYRTGQQLGVDGKNTPIAFNPTDKLSLDGERFILTKGKEWQNGAVYTLEHDGSKTVTYYYNATSKQGYFVLKTKDGLIIELGSTPDSRMELANYNAPLKWMVSRIEDRKGNYITYHYFKSKTNGESYPLEIRYGGNTRTKQLPFNRVLFEYESRSDVKTRYIAGNALKITKRVKRISSFSNEQLVRKYECEYIETGVSKQSQLTKIQECGSNDTCLNPTTFVYSNSSAVAYKAYSNPITAPSKFKNTTYVQSMDANGDGINDLLIGNAVSKTLEVLMGARNFVTQSSAASQTWPKILQVPTTSTSTFQANRKTVLTGFNNDAICTGDFNGDAKEDLVVLQKNKLKLYVSKCGQNYSVAFEKAFEASDKFFESVVKPLTGDFDGNGLLDVILLHTNGSSQGYFCSLSQGKLKVKRLLNPLPNLKSTYGPLGNTSEVSPADIDSDDITDLAVTSLQKPEIIYFKGRASGVFERRLTTKYTTYTLKTIWADCDNDGMQDLIRIHSPALKSLVAVAYNVMYIYLNKGNFDFQKESVFTKQYAYYNFSSRSVLNQPMFVDVNLDGNIDVYFCEEKSSSLFLGNGRGHFTQDPNAKNLLPSGHLLSDYHLVPGRFFPTPSVNFFALKKDNSGSHYLVEQYTEPKAMLTRITEGHGKRIDIHYQPLSKANVYQKNDSYPVSFPKVTYQGPLYVVSAVVETNGAIQEATKYNYENAVLDQNRGFLGFRKIITNNVTQGSRVENVFDLDHTYGSNNLRSSKTYQGSVLVKSVEQEFKVYKPFYGVYNCLIVKSIGKSFDPVKGQLLSTVTSTFSHDNWGNTIASNMVYSDGRQERLYNTYINDPATRTIGRLSKSTREIVEVNGTIVQKNSASEYDADGWLSKEIIEPGNDTLEMASEYKRDLQGNIVQTRVTAWDGQKTSTRVKSFVYDKEGRFRIKTINEAGFESTMEYDQGTGKQLSATDPNGLVVSTKYDGLGRPSELIFPDKSWTRFGYFRVSNYLGALTAVHVKVEKTSKGAYRATFYDTDERVVREETLDKFDRLIAVDYVYDAKGNLELKSLPYFKGQPIKWVKYLFDVVGRLVSTQMPDGTQTSMVYQGLATTFTDELGLKTRVLKDIHGRDIEITDAKGNVVKKQYDLDGNLLKTAFGIRSITTRFDLRGLPIEIHDPSAGTTVNKYNGFGELIQSVTPNGIIRIRYDDLGRPIERWDGQEKTTFVYDTEWLGKVSEIIKPDVLQSFHYNSLGQPTVERKVVLGRTFVSETKYNNTSGEIQSLLYPSGKTQVDFEYKMGEINAVKMAGQVLWTLDEQDIWGNATSFSYGNGIKTTCKFDPVRGWMLSTEASNQTGKVQDWEFTYNPLGSVTRQRDHRAGKEEHYTYDDLTQLTTALIPGVDTLKMTYTKYGELTSKSDVGQYFWNSKGHLDSILLKEGVDCALNQQITYTPFGKVKSVTWGNQRMEIVYDANYQRVAQKRWENGRLVRTRYYVGLTEVDVDAKGIEVVKDYISNGTGAFAIRETGTFQPLGRMLYLHTNHQGSVVAISDATGVLIETLNYDPWGKRRAADWTPLVKPFVFVFDRGYTMHEHYEDPELVDMNGRIFHPPIGIFLSPDPVYQSTDFTHLLGRYAYVGNNPVTLIDPSGYFSLNPGDWAKSIYNSVKDHWKSIVTVTAAVTAGAVVMVATLGTQPVLAGMAAGFVGGLTGSLLNGQSLGTALGAAYRGAVIGGVSAGFTAGLGHGGILVGNSFLTETARAAGHGIIQGGVSVANGGSFWSGAAAGFASSAISSSIEASGWNPGYAGNVAISATVGGVSAEIMGGNFVNGAVSGAFVYMYNHGLVDLIGPSEALDLGTMWWVEEDKSIAANHTIGTIYGGVATSVVLTLYAGTPPGWYTYLAVGIGLGVNKAWIYFSPKPWLNDSKK